MKKIYTLIGLTLLGVMALMPAANAQITITSADMPTAGLKFVNGNDTTSTNLKRLTPGPSGANVTWSLTGLTLTYLDTNSYVAASSTPYASFFPTATLADSTYGTAGYNYLDVSGSALSIVGGVQNQYGYNVPVLFNPPVIELNIPSTYLNVNNGSSVGLTKAIPVSYVVYDSAKASIYITYKDTIDAYGTITTPWYGPYTVLRQKTYQVDVDSLFLHSSATKSWAFYQAQVQKSYTYTWFEKGLGTAVATMTTDTNNKVNSVSWYRGTPDAVTEISQQHNTFVYPNPAKNEVNFRYTTQSNLNVMVYDITGRQVTQTEMVDGVSILNTSSFSNGMYLYRVTDKSGNLLDNGKFTVMQ